MNPLEPVMVAGPTGVGVLLGCSFGGVLGRLLRGALVEHAGDLAIDDLLDLGVVDAGRGAGRPVPDRRHRRAVGAGGGGRASATPRWRGHHGERKQTRRA